MTVATTVANTPETSEDESRTRLWGNNPLWYGAYQPLTYRAGVVCETCWLRWQVVLGVGTDFCPHG